MRDVGAWAAKWRLNALVCGALVLVQACDKSRDSVATGPTEGTSMTSGALPSPDASAPGKPESEPEPDLALRETSRYRIRLPADAVPTSEGRLGHAYRAKRAAGDLSITLAPSDVGDLESLKRHALKLSKKPPLVETEPAGDGFIVVKAGKEGSSDRPVEVFVAKPAPTAAPSPEAPEPGPEPRGAYWVIRCRGPAADLDLLRAICTSLEPRAAWATPTARREAEASPNP